MINEKTTRAVHGIIGLDPTKMKMPNLPLPALGSGLFWHTIAAGGGYRVEKNSITKCCRIIDRYGIIRSWGTEEAMLRLFWQMLWCRQ
ncbi:hypothetical protein [Ruminococcus sp. HUN007]|uniref:hypothetical protein n=1 Tax=Ruminococcus sp. HUN007 TaxID=1514668 RepID=UPI0005D2C5F5|nr:hypothetical protein [Ruminococcus sp. HUN007]